MTGRRITGAFLLTNAPAIGSEAYLAEVNVTLGEDTKLLGILAVVGEMTDSSK